VTIGILGGGQLGYMLALAGYPLVFISAFSTLRQKLRWGASPRASPPSTPTVLPSRNLPPGWSW